MRDCVRLFANKFQSFDKKRDIKVQERKSEILLKRSRPLTVGLCVENLYAGLPADKI